MVKLKPKIAAEAKAAKKRAERRGEDKEKAAADALRQAVRLPIPSEAEIVEAWRELEMAAPPPAADQPTAGHPAADASRTNCTCARAGTRVCTRVCTGVRPRRRLTSLRLGVCRCHQPSFVSRRCLLQFRHRPAARLVHLLYRRLLRADSA